MILTEFQNQILDELYFLISYQQLKEIFTHESELKINLELLWNENIIEAQQLQTANGQFTEATNSHQTNFDALYFVATRKGLLLHNSR